MANYLKNNDQAPIKEACDTLHSTVTNAPTTTHFSSTSSTADDETTTSQVSSTQPTTSTTGSDFEEIIGFECQTNFLQFKAQNTLDVSENLELLQDITDRCIGPQNVGLVFEYFTIIAPDTFALKVRTEDGVDKINDMIEFIDSGSPTTEFEVGNSNGQLTVSNDCENTISRLNTIMINYHRDHLSIDKCFSMSSTGAPTTTTTLSLTSSTTSPGSTAVPDEINCYCDCDTIYFPGVPRFNEEKIPRADCMSDPECDFFIDQGSTWVPDDKWAYTKTDDGNIDCAVKAYSNDFNFWFNNQDPQPKYCEIWVTECDTEYPSASPSALPSESPSESPSALPSESPSESPTLIQTTTTTI